MFEKFQPKNIMSATKVKQQFKFKLPPIWKQNGAQTKNNLRKFSKQNQDWNLQVSQFTAIGLSHNWGKFWK